MQDNECKQLKAAWRTICILWGAFFASLAVYLAVVLFIQQTDIQIYLSSSLPQEIVGSLQYALFAVSLLSLVMAHLLRKLFLHSKGAADQTRQPDASTHPAAAKYTTALILSAALSESVAIYGLIVFFIAKDIVTFCILLAVSASAMLFFRPRKTELFELAERMRT